MNAVRRAMTWGTAAMVVAFALLAVRTDGGRPPLADAASGRPATLEQAGPAEPLFVPWVGRGAGRGDIAFVGRLGGTTRAITARGSLVYAAIDDHLAVLDASDPANVRLLSQTMPIGDPMSMLLLEGGTLYALTGPSTVRAFDVTAPTEPHERSSVLVPGTVSAMRLLDQGLVAAVDSPDAACLVTVADDGRNLSLAGELDGGPCAGVEPVPSEGLAYAISVAGRVSVVDIADMRQPERRGDVGTGARVASGSLLVDAHLFIAHAYGLQVVDASEPYRPEDVASLPIRASFDDMVHVDGRLYAADGSMGLRVIDISDPAQPRASGEVPYSGGLTSVTMGDLLYAAGPRAHLVVYDRYDPDAPAEVATFRPFKHAVAVAGGREHAYVVTNGPQGMSVVADNDFDPLGEVGFLPLSKADWLADDEVRIAAMSPYAILQYYGFLLSVDVRAPANPESRRLLALAGSVDMAVVGKHLFSAGDWLRVVDMNPPSDPEIVFSRLFASGFAQAGTAQAVAADGNRLYVAIRAVTAGRETHLYMFDTTDPTSPRPIGVLSNVGPVVSMASDLGMVYVSGGTSGAHGLRVIDARDAGNIHPVGPGGAIAFEGPARHLDLDGDRLVVAEARTFDDGARRETGRDGVHVFSVARRDRPIERQFIPFDGPVGGVDVRGDRLYVAAKDQGLAIVDLSNVP